MSKRGLLVVISGPSGVGKGTVRNEFMKNEDLNRCYSVSMTSRGMRPGEQDGVDYFFVTREQFEKAVEVKAEKNQALLEQMISMDEGASYLEN